MFGSTPHHSYYGGGFALRWVFVRYNTCFLKYSLFWLADVIMTSPALLTDAVLTSLELLAIVVGVALIRLGGVKLVCTIVSSNFTNFLVLPDPTPYSESESLSLYWHFCPFLPDLFYAFSSFSIFSVSCAKFWFTGLPFFLPILAAWKLDFSFPSFSNLWQSRVSCVVSSSLGKKSIASSDMSCRWQR